MIRILSFSFSIVLVVGPAAAVEVGEQVQRHGDEIMVCGQLFHTTAPVVLWLDPAGYDAYRVERRFGPIEESSWEEAAKELPDSATPNRYGIRKDGLDREQLERVRGGGWDLPMLQSVVDQFVMHYDVCGTAQTCFRVLHDERCLSVHFMLDVDGTIYQTLDVKDRAWHATISNSRSIGVEIAQIGAYPPDKTAALEKWYAPRPDGTIELRPPRPFDTFAVRTNPFHGRPDRPELIRGTIQGRDLVQYDFTPEQYDSLIKLTATLCKIFPKIKCDYPKDADGTLIPQMLSKDDWQNFQGVLGHYHIQRNKTDPGPAFNWEKVVGGAKELLK